MTPEELEKLPKPLERTMTALEMDIMLEVVNRIWECSQITPVTDWLLNRMTAIGMSKKRIKEILREGVKTAGIDIDEIYETAARSDYVRNSEIYKAAGMDAIPYEDNDWLKQVVQAVKDQTTDSLRLMENITKTTGFNVPMGNGKKVFTPMSEYLERSLDEAVMKITTGAKTYSQAIGDVIDEMTSSGVRVVDYASGKSDRIEVAARRAVMTGIAQMTDKVNEHNAKELGTDYWEVEWHLGARNMGTGYMNHQSWQGKVYSSAEMRTVCGLGEMLGFAGINCYHIRFPFIPGISKRKYTDEWLVEQNRKENEKKSFHGKEDDTYAALQDQRKLERTIRKQNRKENEKKSFHGKEYDTYAALQYQRKLERTIRKQKQDIKLLEKARADKDDLTAARCRKRLTEKTYVEFSKAMGLRQQRERLKVGEANPTKEELEAIEKRKRIAIIKSELKELGFRGKINLEPSKVDFEKLGFDSEHINDERQHEVTFDEAKGFIRRASFSETVWKGQFERYYSEDGAAYVRTSDAFIRTAFKREEYSDNILKALEIVRHGR